MADYAIKIHFFISLIVDNIAHLCIIVVKEMLKDMVQIEASNHLFDDHVYPFYCG